MTTISAQEFRSRLENGETTFREMNIEGNVDLAGVRPEKIVLVDVNINGNIDLGSDFSLEEISVHSSKLTGSISRCVITAGVWSLHNTDKMYFSAGGSMLVSRILEEHLK